MLQITRRPIGCNENNSNYFSRNSRELVLSGELRGARTAVAAGITSRGHAPALALCRRLIEAGVDPRTKLSLYRENGTRALTVRSIGEGAQLRIDGDGTRFERLPEPSKGGPPAPPVRQNGRGR